MVNVAEFYEKLVMGGSHDHLTGNMDLDYSLYSTWQSERIQAVFGIM